MKCPECSESNEAGMAFCIFCGHSLAPSAQAIAPVQNPLPPVPLPVTPSQDELMRASSAQPLVYICTVCNKADPLNGQFCVYCGARTVQAQAVAAMPAFSAGSSQSIPALSSSSESRNLSEEIVRGISKQSSQEQAGVGVLGIILGVVLGTAMALGLVFLKKDDVQKNALETYWPKHGLLVYASSPNADVKLFDANEQFLVFGKSSLAHGTFVLPSVRAGNHLLKVSDDKGKESSQDLVLKSDERNIIGYPNRLELK